MDRANEKLAERSYLEENSINGGEKGGIRTGKKCEGGYNAYDREKHEIISRNTR